LDYGPAACRQIAGYMVSMVRLRFDTPLGLDRVPSYTG
jgi:hypothetical protein